MRTKLFLASAAAGVLIVAAGLVSAAPYQTAVPECGDIVQQAGRKLCLDTVLPGQLMCLPEIGEKRAAQIIELRDSKPRVTLQDLEPISGISQRMVDLWKVYFYTQNE